MTDDDRRPAFPAVYEQLQRYCAALDLGDVDGVLACFTADASVSFQAGAFVLQGTAELRAFFERRDGPRHQGFSELRASLHLLGNCAVDVDVRTGIPTATSHALVCHHGVIDGRPATAQRGVRYVDEFAWTGGQWRIARREHAPLWHVVTKG